MAKKILCMFITLAMMMGQICFAADETYDERAIVGDMGRAYRYEFSNFNSDGQIVSGNVSVNDGLLCFDGEGSYLANVFAVDSTWALKVRFKYTGAGVGMMVRSGAQRLKMHINEGTFGYLDSTNPNNHQWTDTVKHGENIWYEYIITVKDLCAEYYRRAEGEDKYTKVWTAPHMTTGGGNEGAQFFTSGGSVAQIDYFYVYKPGVPDLPDPPDPGEYVITDEETVLGFNDRTYCVEDFEDDEVADGFNVSEAQISGGCLNMTAQGGQKTVNYDSSLPDECFLNFRMRFGSAANITMYKGTHRFILNINPKLITANVVGTTTHQVRLDKSIENQWYDWLIKLSSDSKATVYYKESDSDKYESLYSELEFGVNSGRGLKLQTGSEGYVEIDYLRVYGGMYIENGGITSADGSVSAKATALFDLPSGLNARNIAGILAVYDKYGYMKSSDIRTYLAEPGKEVAVSLSVNEDIGDCNAAFMLWDSLLNYQPLTDVCSTAEDTTDAGITVGDGVNVSAYLNTVSVSGTTEANKFVTIGLSPDEQSESIVNIKQIKTDSNGKFAAAVRLDAEKYDSGVYYVHTAVKGSPKQTLTAELYGRNDFETMIEDFRKARDDGTLQTVSEKYFDILCGSDVDKTLYSKIIAQKLETELDDESFADMKEFIEDMAAVAEYANKYTVAVETVNKACKNENWAEIKKTIFSDYAECFGLDESVLSGIENEKRLFSRMYGKSYENISEVCGAVQKAADDEKAAEIAERNNSGIGGGSSGGSRVKTPSIGVGGNAVNLVEPTEPKTPDTVPSAPFADETNVPWAADSITMLRQRGIVSGSGDGYFYPERAVTRAEFLKMIMKVFRTEIAENGVESGFSDVGRDYWGCDYIITAAKLGIINGDENGRFNPDADITRADMATVVKRVADMNGIELVAVAPSVIFSDAYLIPEYAYDSIADLQQAGILSGDNGRFNPVANLSRAEAAVVFGRLLSTYGEELMNE